MKVEQDLNEQALREKLNGAAEGRTDLAGYQVVCGCRRAVWGRKENVALAFCGRADSLWVLDLERSELREVPLSRIIKIVENPSCEYLFFYYGPPFKERFFVPYVGVSEMSRSWCNQLEAAAEFHLFCRGRRMNLPRWLMRLCRLGRRKEASTADGRAGAFPAGDVLRPAGEDRSAGAAEGQ